VFSYLHEYRSKRAVPTQSKPQELRRQWWRPTIKKNAAALTITRERETWRYNRFDTTEKRIKGRNKSKNSENKYYINI
jgi:hypothetical protein